MPDNSIMLLSSRTPGTAFLLGCALAMVAAVAAAAEAPVIDPRPVWNVKPEFRSEDARKELSGAACARTAPPFQSCLIANDEEKFAQFFSIEGTRIIPGKVVCLTGGNGNPDAEGVAFDVDDNYFYVTGSHGRSRHKNKPNDSSYVVFRFKANVATSDSDECDKPAVGIEPSGKLRAILANAEHIDEYYNQALCAGGINIEGIAAREKRLYFGLRGPSIKGEAFILSVAVDGIFGDGDPQTRVRALTLGDDTGIRDLAAVANGLLVLSGPVNEQAVKPAVFHWDDSSGTLTKLAVLGDLPANAKAETLLVLEENADHYRVLIMFDGPENGRPTEYRIPRK